MKIENDRVDMDSLSRVSEGVWGTRIWVETGVYLSECNELVEGWVGGADPLSTGA